MSAVRVYIASALSQAPRAREYADHLKATGAFTICSGWHDTGDTVDPSDEATRRDILVTNLADLARAQVVLALMAWGIPRGAHAEIGWSLAMGKPVVWFASGDGLGTSLFTAHPLVALVHSHAEVMPQLHRVACDIVAARARLKSIPPRVDVESSAKWPVAK